MGHAKYRLLDRYKHYYPSDLQCKIKGRWPLVPRRQGYMVRLNFETTVN